MAENTSFPPDICQHVFQGIDIPLTYLRDKNIRQILEEDRENLSQLLQKTLPNKPCRILYIGCIPGKTAHSLALNGHEVIALGLCQEQTDYARQNHQQDNLSLVKSDFLEFVRQKKHEHSSFDVLLFHDSLQYLNPLEEIFSKARLLLKEKGRIIVCDEFILDSSLKKIIPVHLRKDLTASIFENGFYIKKQLDLGEKVLQGLDSLISHLESYNNMQAASGDQKVLRLTQQLLDDWKRKREWHLNRQVEYVLLNLIIGDIYIRAYAEGDEKDILPIFNKVFSTDRSMAHWLWKYRDNPYDRTRIALAVDREENIAAHYGGYPVRFFSRWPGFESFLACQAGDTFTSPEFRNIGLGPTSILSRTTFYYFDRFLQDNFAFAYGFNTGNIRKFGERYLGYIYGEEVPYLVLYRSESKASTWCFMKRKIFQGIRIHRIFEPGKELDDFFHRVKNQYDLLACRDSEYLKWRYFDAPDNDYYFFTSHVRSGMAGWAVFKKQKDTLILGDCLFDRKYTDIPPALFEHVFSCFPDSRRVTTWCSPYPKWWMNCLLDCGFVREEEPNGLAPCYKVFISGFPVRSFQIGQFLYYTMGDSDLF